jgi:hypothetical protein
VFDRETDMRALITVAAVLLASAAWGADKTVPVVVTNPSVTVEVGNADPIPVTVRATAAPLPIALRSQDPANLVMLVARNGSYHQKFPNGTESSDAYSVPPGQALIITDVSLEVRGNFLPGGFVCGNVISYRICGRVEESGLLAFASEHLTTGFLFSPQGTVVADSQLLGYLAPIPAQ